MNLFKKLFGRQEPIPEEKDDKNPDNTKLIYLLDIYSQNSSAENYKAVVSEILEGNSFLMLPTTENPAKNLNHGWKIANGDKTIQITSVFNQDGLKVLGAFSDEKSMLSWTKHPTAYNAIASKAVIDICERHGIGRIVINSGLKNMFVLQKNSGHLKEVNIAEGTNMYVGLPARPLDKRIIEKLVKNFRSIDTIEEVYQYLQVANKEASIVLGVKMSVISDNSKTALFNAVTVALTGEKTEYPVDIRILDTDNALQLARGVQNALFYKR
ncbi:MAG TPA: SseB family protein [Mucilaginibacter sp.]|nr:SseB family protein [Mucilaginibacter sp.]